MTSKHVLDELSAYIDGEARNPEAVARHLQQCALCARRHVELSKLSAHVKALPRPETHPAFLTRVMAHVSDYAAGRDPGAPRTVLVRRTTWPWLRLPGLAAVAAVSLVIAGALVFHRQAEEQPGLAPAPGAVAIGDEDDLLWRIEEKLAQGGHSVVLATDDLAVMEDADDAVAVAELVELAVLAVLAEAEWLDAGAVGVVTVNDVDEAIVSLDESETQAFIDLLHEYSMEG